MENRARFKNLGLGLGLRPDHYPHITQYSPKLKWFEALSENYMGLSHSGSGRGLKTLEGLRQNYEIVLHGVSLSIASTDPLNFTYLKKLKDLAMKIQPQWISDHLCWTSVNGENLHDLMPIPYNKESLDHVVSRVIQVQDYLKAPILIENVSSYITFEHSEVSEWQFLNTMTRKTGCGLLLDVNNVYVNSVNHGFDPVKYLQALDPASIGQIHLAGHSRQGSLLIDTHDGPVCDEVWDLFRQAVKLFGPLSTMVEWDANIPKFEVLEAEMAKAGVLMSRETEVIREIPPELT